jgi:hypothetical protein
MLESTLAKFDFRFDLRFDFGIRLKNTVRKSGRVEFRAFEDYLRFVQCACEVQFSVWVKGPSKEDNPESLLGLSSLLESPLSLKLHFKVAHFKGSQTSKARSSALTSVFLLIIQGTISS